MTTLITGGGSQIGTRLAKLLKEANRNVLFASRSGRVPEGFDSVPFDWFDPSTFDNAFAKDSQIQSVYILPPTGLVQVVDFVKPFINLAVSKGVKRFVLLSSSDLDKGTDTSGAGEIHEYLDSKGLSYLALRPTWFIDNLLLFTASIQGEDQIITASPKGGVPFVAVDDIAQAAFNGIVNSGPEQQVGDLILIGPDLLSYNDVAKVLSDVLGRRITNKVITPAERLQGLIASGLSEDYATMLVTLEKAIEQGSEESLPSAPRKVVGKISVRDWVEKNKDVLAKA